MKRNSETSMDELLDKIQCVHIKDDDDIVEDEFDIHYYRRNYEMNDIVQLWLKYRYDRYFMEYRFSVEDVRYLLNENIINEEEKTICMHILTCMKEQEYALFELFLSYGVNPDDYIERCLNADQHQYLELLHIYGGKKDHDQFQYALCHAKMKCIGYFIKSGYIPSKHDLHICPYHIREYVLQSTPVSNDNMFI